jgi:hypothetical protein
VAWIHSAGDRDWYACRSCHAAIVADDREGLLDRSNLIPIPRTLPERYAPHFRDRARRLHEEFWERRSGPSRPA